MFQMMNLKMIWILKMILIYQYLQKKRNLQNVNCIVWEVQRTNYYNCHQKSLDQKKNFHIQKRILLQKVRKNYKEKKNYKNNKKNKNNKLSIKFLMKQVENKNKDNNKKIKKQKKHINIVHFHQMILL